MGQCDHIFLAGRWQDGEPGAVVEVPADSLVALFTLQYCQNSDIRVILVTNRVNPATCVFPVPLRSLGFRVLVKEEEECPEVLCHCELPAMVSQDEEDEEERQGKVKDNGGSLKERKEVWEANQDIDGKEEKEEEEKVEEKEEEEEEKVEEKEVEEEEDNKEKGRKINENGTETRQKENKENDDAWRTGSWCCAGLCSSLRLAVTQMTEGTAAGGTAHHAASLLGFRGGCLQACAEVSVWTKFCEVEAPVALLAAALAPCTEGEEVAFPQELLRYECHLHRPPILHNALKRKQRHIRETIQDSTQREEMCRLPLAQLPPLTHQFAEGPDMTLADLMLFACFHLVLAGLAAAKVVPEGVTPLVATWHSTMAQNSHIQAALPVLQAAEALFAGTSRAVAPPRIVVPEVPDVSIYKSDPERCKASRGAFTRQGDVEEVLRVVEEARVEPDYTSWPPYTSSSSSSSSFFSSNTSDAMPLHSLLPALSLEGHIPQSRLERKMQQVENICSAVLTLTQPGDVVVDFCSGGGHVGIPLAQCLPGCRVLLVENKVASLLRARERVRSLRLANVWFVQTNLDYFRGGFNVGVSLHACGAATDLVLRKCVAQRAAFVVTPCCYGSIRPNHVVSYPRSKAFRDLSLTLDQYLTLGHAADQTHGQDNPKTEQGQRCMRLVDEDRLEGVREVGYMGVLALMNPPSCSPKNHLLLGKPLT